MKNIACIILAAGKSTRMKSDMPKVMHPLCGRPVLNYVLDLVKDSKISNVIAVLGHRHQEVRKIIPAGIKIAIQKRLAGTADALKSALPLLRNFKGTLLVLYADSPLLKKETVKQLLKQHKDGNSDVTLLTAVLEKPFGYGRILRDKYAAICGIAEDKDVDDYQKDIKEINTGIACFNKEKLERAIRHVQANNRKKEFYLTDVIGILYKNGAVINNLLLKDIDEALGINSRLDLAKANKLMHKRINEALMRSGVSIIDPDSSLISYGVKIGQDTVIYPFTVIQNNVRIGKRCSIGPFVHLREGTRIEDDVAVGNFLEIARSILSSKTLIKHFGYIGDSRIGRQVNIGAGTVTANFDGKRKHSTVIKDGAFIGCDTVFIAPLKIGRGAQTGAGSVIVKNTNVPDKSIVVGIPAKLLKKKR